MAQTIGLQHSEGACIDEEEEEDENEGVDDEEEDVLIISSYIDECIFICTSQNKS